MENQHREIKGYRELDQGEIDLMNTIKEEGVELAGLIGTLLSLEEIDKRWVAIGKTHLQEGIMALVRAVAQPTSF